jgi:hypothetical protein
LASPEGMILYSFSFPFSDGIIESCQITSSSSIDCGHSDFRCSADADVVLFSSPP